jgi:hypothetical protein
MTPILSAGDVGLVATVVISGLRVWRVVDRALQKKKPGEGLLSHFVGFKYRLVSITLQFLARGHLQRLKHFPS